MKRNFDKAVTRAAAEGYTRYLMFNRWWALRPGAQYRVDYSRRQIVELA